MTREMSAQPEKGKNPGPRIPSCRSNPVIRELQSDFNPALRVWPDPGCDHLVLNAEQEQRNEHGAIGR
jgi:hypothetical protein